MMTTLLEYSCLYQGDWRPSICLLLATSRNKLLVGSSWTFYQRCVCTQGRT